MIFNLIAGYQWLMILIIIPSIPFGIVLMCKLLNRRRRK